MFNLPSLFVVYFDCKNRANRTPLGVLKCPLIVQIVLLIKK